MNTIWIALLVIFGIYALYEVLRWIATWLADHFLDDMWKG